MWMAAFLARRLPVDLWAHTSPCMQAATVSPVPITLTSIGLSTTLQYHSDICDKNLHGYLSDPLLILKSSRRPSRSPHINEFKNRIETLLSSQRFLASILFLPFFTS